MDFFKKTKCFYRYGVYFFLLLHPLCALSQVYRCSENGKTLYQQLPCEKTGTKGVQVKIHSPSNQEPVNTAPITKTTNPDSTLPSSKASGNEKQAQQILTPQKSEIEYLADTCLDWYRPRLRDPKGAYYREERFERDVLSFVIHFTNHEGGFIRKAAGCEFRNGSLQETWTQKQAEKHMW